MIKMNAKNVTLIVIGWAAILVLRTSPADALPAVIRIGGMFSDGEDELEAAFRFAIERINDDPSMLPSSTLIAQVEHVSGHDSYQVSKHVCALANMGVAGIVGPTSEVTSLHVRSVCDILEIPHIEVSWDIEQRLDALSINLYPRPEILARAYLDVAKGLGWDHFAICYDRNEGVVQYQEFFKQARDRGWDIKLYQFSKGEAFREVFWKIKMAKETNIILDVRQESLIEAMKQAQQVGLMTEYHAYIITSLDFVTEDLEDFRYSGARITGFRLVEDDNYELTTLSSDWIYLNHKTGNRIGIDPPDKMRTQTALVYDAVKLLATALEGLDKSQTVEINPVSCVDEVPWSHGTSLVNYMRPIIFRGISGLLTFNEYGHRSLFTLDLMALDKNGITNVGYWNTNGGLNITNTFLESYSEFAITQKPWIVTTVETEPYTMKRISSLAPKGNAQFEGYAVDLIEELSMLLGFNYELRLCKDGKYGSENPDGSWNGMLGELIREEADIAIVDLTITRKREKVVDFTLPFMTTGVSILYTKPAKAESSLFGFLSPFTMTVWVYLCLSTALISMIFFVVGRLSPYEWDNPFPCKEDEPILMNDCSVKNSFWFTVGSLMQQGSDLAPKSMSTRIIGGSWYFFTLIIIASYTANLAAFLTIEVTSYPFNSAEELEALASTGKSKIEFGCVHSGSTRVAFRESPDPILNKLSEHMEKRPQMFVDSNGMGKDRVMKGNYAFFMEAASIEYAVERQCNFTQIGNTLDSKGYGIATRKDSPIRHALSRGILKLQEKGTLHILYERWWKQKRGGGKCTQGGGGAAAPMALANVGGVFVVLCLGGTVSIFLAVVEFLYATRKDAPDSKTMWEDVMHDMKFFLRLQEYTKPTKRRRGSKTGSGSSSSSSKSKATAEEGPKPPN